MNLVTKLSLVVAAVLAIAAGTANGGVYPIDPIDPQDHLHTIGPDLVVGAATQTSVMITNRGNRFARLFRVFVVGTAQPVGSCGAVASYVFFVAGLPAGDSVSVTVPSSPWDRTVIVDLNNWVHETNELNNRGVVPYDRLGC